MELSYSGDRNVKNPGIEEVRAAITGLKYDEFLILARDEEEYIQVYHNDDGTFQLEYRAGSEEEHYGTDPDEIDVNDVVNAFSAYFENASGQWHSAWNWELMEFDESDFVEDDDE